MLVVFQGRPVVVNWYLYKGCNHQTEDFSLVADNQIKVFIKGPDNTFACPLTIERDSQNKQYVSISVDTSGMSVGMYDAKLVWTKSRNSLSCKCGHDDARNYSALSGIFFVTRNVNEDNTHLDSGETAVKVLRSFVDPFGYDGLSAYEIAVFHGYEGTEEEWIDNIGAKGNSVSIEKVADYFYKTEYDTIDYDYAKAHIDDADPSVGACSAIFANSLVGRNFDWKYDYQAAFFVRTHNSQGRYAVDGIAGMKELTAQVADSREYSDAYKVLPFMLQDGINENGLFAEMNVVPSKGNTHTTPLVEKRETISALMLVRYILDHFDNVDDAVNYIKNYVEVYMPAKLTAMGYELHYMIAEKDGEAATILEFIDNAIVVVESNISTNFHVYGVETLDNGKVYTNHDTPTHLPSSLGIEPYGSGLERWNILASANITDEASMRSAIDSVKYSKAYQNGTNPWWISEQVGGSITVDSNIPYLELFTLVAQTKQKWDNRSRETADVWITTHSCVYNLEKGTIEVRVQEENGSYKFGDGSDVDLSVIGNLQDLETTAKSNLVAAINEASGINGDEIHIKPKSADDGVKVHIDEEDGFIVLEPIVGQGYGVKIRAFGNEINMINGNLYINPFSGGVIIGSNDQDAGDNYLAGNWYNNGALIGGIKRLSGPIPVGQNIQESALRSIGINEKLIFDGYISRVKRYEVGEILNVTYAIDDGTTKRFVLAGYCWIDFELSTLTQYTFSRNSDGTWKVELVEF